MIKELFHFTDGAMLEGITTRLDEFIDFCRVPDKNGIYCKKTTLTRISVSVISFMIFKATVSK